MYKTNNNILSTKLNVSVYCMCMHVYEHESDT